MKKICITTILSTFIFLGSSQLALSEKLNEVSATLTVQVGPTADPSGDLVNLLKALGLL